MVQYPCGCHAKVCYAVAEAAGVTVPCTPDFETFLLIRRGGLKCSGLGEWLGVFLYCSSQMVDLHLVVFTCFIFSVLVLVLGWQSLLS